MMMLELSPATLLMHCGSIQGGNAVCADKVEHKLTIKDVEYDGSSDKKITLGTAAFRNTNDDTTSTNTLITTSSNASLNTLDLTTLNMVTGGNITLDGGNLLLKRNSKIKVLDKDLFSYSNGILTINY